MTRLQFGNSAFPVYNSNEERSGLEIVPI